MNVREKECKSVDIRPSLLCILQIDKLFYTVLLWVTPPPLPLFVCPTSHTLFSDL